MQVLIDDMKNTAGTAYAGGRGPFGFSPDELEDAVREELELPPIEREKKGADD